MDNGREMPSLFAFRSRCLSARYLGRSLMVFSHRLNCHVSADDRLVYLCPNGDREAENKYILEKHLTLVIRFYRKVVGKPSCHFLYVSIILKDSHVDRKGKWSSLLIKFLSMNSRQLCSHAILKDLGMYYNQSNCLFLFLNSSFMP